MTKEYIQVGPSCDLDKHGDPITPKYIEVDVGPDYVPDPNWYKKYPERGKKRTKRRSLRK